MGLRQARPAAKRDAPAVPEGSPERRYIHRGGNPPAPRPESSLVLSGDIAVHQRRDAGVGGLIMSLDIRREATYADGRWDWSVWIDGPDVELDQVESVRWVLDPTFREPIVRVEQRQSKFRLDSSGLGEIEI